MNKNEGDEPAAEFASRPLPSNRTLRQEYELGEFAVSHALRVLADEGLIYSVPRRGYYVRRDVATTPDTKA